MRDFGLFNKPPLVSLLFLTRGGVIRNTSDPALRPDVVCDQSCSCRITEVELNVVDLVVMAHRNLLNEDTLALLILCLPVRKNTS